MIHSGERTAEKDVAQTVVEEVTVFGDISGMHPEDIQTFARTTHHLYGGSYPNREAGISDEEVIERTRRTLSVAGIPDSIPIVVCGSTDERATRILEDLNSRRKKVPEGFYWIVDKEPTALMQAFDNGGVGDVSEPILGSITIVGFGLRSREPFDYSDKSIGVRTAVLVPVPFPVHPSPAV